jgi:Family of unknown function (DUF6492)
MELANTAASWAIITPSYRGDLNRCKLLCKSMDAFVTGPWHHYIIVEKGDLALFKPLNGPNRTILQMELLLPRSFFHLTRIPFVNHRSLWFSWRTGFMIGWQIQQIIKLEMAFRLAETGLLYCDSDVFFVRRFDMANLSENGAFQLYSSVHPFPREQAPNPNYIDASAIQLGLIGDPFPCPSYVDNLVAWHAPTVRALCKHIEKVSNQKWHFALGKNYIISEYNLYGIFVDRILESNIHLKPTALSLCKTAWHKNDVAIVGLERFCTELLPHQVAVGVQSFLGVGVEDLSNELQKSIARAQAEI